MQRFTSPLIVLALLALAACNKPPQDGLFELGASTNASQNIFNAVPADFSYVYAYDFTELDAVLMAQQASSGTFEPIRPMLVEFFGVDIFADGGLNALGVDPRGELALFSPKLSPIVFAKLSDVDAFYDTVARIQDRNPDLEWGEFNLAHTVFQSLTAEENGQSFGVDFGVIAGYAVVRFRTGFESFDVSNDALEAIVTGRAGPALITDPRVDELRTGAFSRELTGLVLVEPGRIWAAVADSPFQEEIGAYESASHEAACDAADQAFFAAMPWMGMSRLSSPENPGSSRGRYVVQLSADAADTADDILTGAATGAAERAADAALFATLGLDLANLFDSFSADPELRNCPSPAALGANLAHARNSNASVVDQVVAMASGGFALALYDINVDGFIPQVDMALMMTTPNPVAVVDAIQGLIESRGARGTVDETAPTITMDYQLLGFSMRIIQRDDRVVIRTGEVPIPLEVSLSSDPMGDDDRFAHGQLRGQRLAEILTSVLNRAAEMGVALDTTSIDASIETYRALDYTTTEFSLDRHQIRVEVEAEYDLDSLREE